MPPPVPPWDLSEVDLDFVARTAYTRVATNDRRHLLGRYRPEVDREHRRAVEHALEQATRSEQAEKAVARAAGGDARQLRGLPCIGSALGGAIIGTKPGERLR